MASPTQYTDAAGNPVADDVMDAAYAFVDSMKGRANDWHGPAPLWYGWALREAFIAGSRLQQEKEKIDEPKTTD